MKINEDKYYLEDLNYYIYDLKRSMMPLIKCLVANIGTWSMIR